MYNNKWAARWAFAAGLILSTAWIALSAQAQQTQTPQATATKPSFQEAAALAKKTGRPLIVFGLSDTCSRCQAVKQGITTSPEFQDLLAQYVTTEIPFGGAEFGKIFQEIVRRDKSIPRAIGAPSVFIFTSKGETVYAGPNRESGIALDEEFKQRLRQGIEKNGNVPRPDGVSKSHAPANSSKPRTWKSKDGKFSVLAALVSFDGATVQLKKSDGKAISVPVTALSSDDVNFLQDQSSK